MKEIAAAARKRLLASNKQGKNRKPDINLTPNHTKNIVGTSREAEASSDADKENTKTKTKKDRPKFNGKIRSLRGTNEVITVNGGQQQNLHQNLYLYFDCSPQYSCALVPEKIIVLYIKIPITKQSQSH